MSKKDQIIKLYETLIPRRRTNLEIAKIVGCSDALVCVYPMDKIKAAFPQSTQS